MQSTNTLTPVSPVRRVSPGRLRELAANIAARPAGWTDLVRFDPCRRWYQRLACEVDFEIWLLSWLPGQHTGFHDHGQSAGAFAVADGVLRERVAPGRRPETDGTVLTRGAVRSFGPHYVHEVANTSQRPAVSVHAYSPPLRGMRQYEVGASGLLSSREQERSW
jgi:predicted metal-dependent enzyme (double-stranded beta helix superfamily)